MTRLLRCGLVLAGTSAATAALVGWLLPVALTAQGSGGVGADGGFDDRLVGGCAAVGLLAATWLWLVTVTAVVEAARAADRRTPRERPALAPAALRRTVLAACGVATLAGLTGPAAHAATPGAAPGGLGPGGSGPASTVASVVARALHDGRPTSGDRRARPGSGVVTVRAGDCLWDIAAHDLAARDGARGRLDDADVEHRWREIYAANRAVIGPDPDLVRPAQRLRLPR